MVFKNRKVAGVQLAKVLQKYKTEHPIAIGLPRGGVVVAAEVAHILHIELDVIVPRKIGAPGQEELAIGALAGDEVYLDQKLIALVEATPDYIQQTIANEKKEAERRLALYRKGRKALQLSKRTVILIDDGIATGATVLASIAYLKSLGASKIIVAAPVAPPETLMALQNQVDAVICLLSPPHFAAVGQFYEHFPQTSDEEVIQLLSG